jgi:hypothetical protein
MKRELTNTDSNAARVAIHDRIITCRANLEIKKISLGKKKREYSHLNNMLSKLTEAIAAEKPVIARAYRNGLKHPLNIVRFVTKGTIEETIQNRN